MRILLSNDDGYHAEGIQVLAYHLRKFADVTIIAPDRNRSAASNSLTLIEPLRPRHLDNGDYCLNGTPADCVYLGLNQILAGQVDLVVSGINAGCNMGDDVLYSGTVAAAFEGRHLGLPSIAVSLDGRQHYDTAAQVVCELIPKLHTSVLKSREILNINVPDLPYDQLKGLQVTRLGYRAAAGEIIKQKDPRDEVIYWIGPAGLPENTSEGTDFHAVANGYVSLTPIQADMTAHHSLANLQQWLDK
ncbi:5'/3'-nucleotidase SurE [Mergibacter septicus]|uniref:5'-nucleotidase SurE n=1 Tax=Mergibacter septicus TaxID=221402 RepID=A0A8D4LNL1_9PAST|nr:5'/3'-nucleotidase SurE [Mergibacter septicus]AWX14856.1 5'/3'-nucleotidase SurE [Mergibacter septicus]QDJ13468.1 5'/3'-nucleotidase SurE [Mergibacter septicus]QDJ14108.1 5'/3'-nucleotidase SurE [Mergibacter septicus]UTU48442.1 5'/3'-nucleotidase SurE [Mergibacter septicus]WMR95929.1 5'/3'-nucleotidase SurE [Mergibacter septicus]